MICENWARRLGGCAPVVAVAGVAFLATPAVGATPADNEIGTTALVVQQVEGTRQQLTRRLALSDDVFQNEVVETGLKSASELHFADDTRITVGPNSKVVLDRFVYDPDPGEGTMVLKVTEGVFRFFSGNMASSNYAIETPSVTVGVRGTIIVGAVNPHTGAFGLILESGNSQATLTDGDGNSVLLDTPGTAAVRFADGAMTTGPIPVWLMNMAGEMDNIIAQANLPAPPPGQDPKSTEETVVVTTPPPPPPPASDPASDPQPSSDGDLRGLPRAAINLGGETPGNGNANDHASDPDGGPGKGNDKGKGKGND